MSPRSSISVPPLLTKLFFLAQILYAVESPVVAPQVVCVTTTLSCLSEKWIMAAIQLLIVAIWVGLFLSFHKNQTRSWHVLDFYRCPSECEYSTKRPSWRPQITDFRIDAPSCEISASINKGELCSIFEPQRLFYFKILFSRITIDLPKRPRDNGTKTL